MSRLRVAIVIVILGLLVMVGASQVKAHLRSTPNIPAALAADTDQARLVAAAEATARRLLDSPASGPATSDSYKETGKQGNTGAQGQRSAGAGGNIIPAAPSAAQAPSGNPQSPAPSPQSAPAHTATVIATLLNVRAGQGTDYDIIGQLQRGAQVTLLSEVGAWPQIRTADGTVGYVSSTYLAFDDATSQDSAPSAPPPSARRGGGGFFGGQGGSAPGGGFGAPSGGQFGAPGGQAPRRGFGSIQGGVATTDDAGNSVRVANQTGSAYQFDADQFLTLLRDEGLTAQNVSITLVESERSNRSATIDGQIVLDCHPIQIPFDPSRPNPPGNGKSGADFCNAVALHETYHLITLATAGWGGNEADADAFASQRLTRYTLVK